MLVVDAGTGQNAINQVQEFDQAVGLTGITITKDLAENGLKSSIFSPTPIKRIGTWVRLAILKSTPPF
jgi:fused signal recognition particle receptor